MKWYDLVFEVIDMRSFSNLWYWIALAVLWSSAAHWVLGVPYDMVLRARRKGGQAARDFEDLARINVNRLTYIGEVAGAWLIASVSFVLTLLGVLAFYYWIEIAQAIFLLAFPMAFVGMLSFAAAFSIHKNGISGEALQKRLMHLRFLVQSIGMASIFVTALFGMYQNLSIGALGQ